MTDDEFRDEVSRLCPSGANVQRDDWVGGGNVRTSYAVWTKEFGGDPGRIFAGSMESVLGKLRELVRQASERAY